MSASVQEFFMQLLVMFSWQSVAFGYIFQLYLSQRYQRELYVASDVLPEDLRSMWVRRRIGELLFLQ